VGWYLWGWQVLGPCCLGVAGRMMTMDRTTGHCSENQETKRKCPWVVLSDSLLWGHRVWQCLCTFKKTTATATCHTTLGSCEGVRPTFGGGENMSKNISVFILSWPYCSLWPTESVAQINSQLTLLSESSPVRCIDPLISIHCSPMIGSQTLPGYICSHLLIRKARQETPANLKMVEKDWFKYYKCGHHNVLQKSLLS
jgi:hypothetical protein